MSTRTLKWTMVPAAAALALAGVVLAPAADAAPRVAGAVSAGQMAVAHRAPLLHTGSRGAAVRIWQFDIDRITGKVPGVSHIAVDGVFGPKTAAATRAFQRYAHIRVDGIVGPQTRAAMQTALHGSRTP